MIRLFPAIDLIGGKVVRLERGDRSRMTVYSDDPAAVAEDFCRRGAEWIHVVDLSAAFEEDEEARAANLAAIKAICGVSGISVDVGGGVRSLERIEKLRELGAARIAIGTALVRDEEFAAEAAARYGDALCADVAARDGAVKVNGWREGAGLKAADVVKHLAELGYRHLVFTDIARDGMQTGIDLDAYRGIAACAGFPVVVSGGVARLDDIRAVAAAEAAAPGAFEGVICGRALYEGNFSLEEALEAATCAAPDSAAPELVGNDEEGGRSC